MGQLGSHICLAHARATSAQDRDRERDRQRETERGEEKQKAQEGQNHHKTNTYIQTKKTKQNMETDVLEKWRRKKHSYVV